MTFARLSPLPKRFFLTPAALIAAAALVTAAPATAQQPPGNGNGATADPAAPGTATAVRTDAPPVIDGVPDDAAWTAATPLTAFTQREPHDGQPASEPTELRILFDADAIYVAVWAWDSEAHAIVPGDAIRDYEVSDADAVIMVFDTYNDQQNGFVFGTTPAGIEYDGQVASQGGGGGFFLGGGMNNTRRFQAGAGGGFNKECPPIA